jgi:undecaprenyldiphospho-muramoylpentapeptide beta-N-acetylglucosaminyltransferase
VTAAARRPRAATIVIAGGGTGGHVYPALALATALQARGHAVEDLQFIGARRGLEARVVPAAGFPLTLLALRGLDRGRTPAALIRSLGAVLAFVGGTLRMVGRFLRRRPTVVVGVGGYASAPCVLAARVLAIPVVVHEQNAGPGLVNRVAVRLGARAAISLPGTPLARAVLTGNPVRAEVASVVRHPDPDRPVLGVVGGSLGAGRINGATLGLASNWRDRSVTIRHVAGARFVDECRVDLDARRGPDDVLVYDLVGYEEHMDRLYGEVSLAVCRAGAVTVAELAAAGVPAVLVPWSGAAGDHQTRNAEALVGAGGAVLLADAACDTGALDAVVSPLLSDPDRLARMGAAARTLARPDAADRLADLVEEVAGARA